MDEDGDAAYGALAAGIAFAVIVGLVAMIGYIAGLWT
jgi:Flp pilus assembly pilin Flp